MTPEQFFQTYQPIALQIQQQTGVPAALTLAQAALETGYGRSSPGGNMFGIKGNGPAGSQKLSTSEVYNGQRQNTQAQFRQYNDQQQSFRDYARLISQDPRYRGVMDASKSGNMTQVAQAIGNSPYATDPNYGQKIYNIMQKGGFAQAGGQVTPKMGAIPQQQPQPINASRTIPKIPIPSRSFSYQQTFTPTQQIPTREAETSTSTYRSPAKILNDFLGKGLTNG